MTEAQWKIAYERVEVMTQEQLIWLMKQIRKEELKFEKMINGKVLWKMN